MPSNAHRVVLVAANRRPGSARAAADIAAEAAAEVSVEQCIGQSA